MAQTAILLDCQGEREAAQLLADVTTFPGWDRLRRRPTSAVSNPIPWGRGRWARLRYAWRFLMQ
ncbi:hypothetical protein ABZT43_50055, partial [Streptomyces sp. NPDC005349]